MNPNIEHLNMPPQCKTYQLILHHTTELLTALKSLPFQKVFSSIAIYLYSHAYLLAFDHLAFASHWQR